MFFDSKCCGKVFSAPRTQIFGFSAQYHLDMDVYVKISAGAQPQRCGFQWKTATGACRCAFQGVLDGFRHEKQVGLPLTNSFGEDCVILPGVVSSKHMRAARTSTNLKITIKVVT